MREEILKLLQETDGFLSGQEISERFGVSRTSIWKAIRQLEEAGYEIEAVRNKGYRLSFEPDFLTAALVEKYLDTEWAGRPTQVFDEVDSTNSEVKRQAEDGAGHGLLVIGEQQSSGRGRRGRTWESPKGAGIFMSLLLKPDIAPGHASMLTLVMGLAVRDALEQMGVPDVKIKWPNDIICSGKKICGILTEMSAQMDYINYIVVGVGINVHNREFPEAVERVATSVLQQTGRRICRAELAAKCMEQFEKYYAVFLKTEDLSGLLDLYQSHLVNCDRKVLVSDLKQDYTGIARGINADGELLVETGDGLKYVSAGEVSVRGVYGYV
ncbi:MAG: biotin--[acetyl-CoA-carboxylase] ligase [Clostridiales bacterium]|nr:biotin--[acetyl-CoA-carboxylase] ligase [Clostridiales bacterium]